MMKHVVVLFAACATIVARADTVTYLVTVDTLNQITNPGTIDFQLNPGTVAPVPPVTATVQFFAGPGLDGSSITTSGDTSGTLPGTLTLMNDVSPGAEYTENITNYGATVSFYLTLSGSGVDPTGNAGGASGTTFLLDFTDYPPSQYLFTNDPDATSTSATDPLWAVAVIDVDNTGVVTTYANPGPCVGGTCATITPTSLPDSTSAPEAGTLGFALLGSLLIAACIRRSATRGRLCH